MITSRQMKELEEYADSQGIHPRELMEKAGEQFFLAVKKKYDLVGKRIVVFAGQGNNGGDGFVAARYFAQENPVLILFFGYKEELSEEARVNYDKVKKKANIIPIHEPADLVKFHVQDGLQLVLIDALLGSGVKGTIREPISSAMEYYNSLSGIKIAVDVPSGLDPDTGEVREKMCHADFIVTFHDLKPGLEKFREKTAVVDIGIAR